jgi:hypothetical protein
MRAWKSIISYLLREAHAAEQSLGAPAGAEVGEEDALAHVGGHPGVHTLAGVVGLAEGLAGVERDGARGANADREVKSGAEA